MLLLRDELALVDLLHVATGHPLFAANMADDKAMQRALKDEYGIEPFAASSGQGVQVSEIRGRSACACKGGCPPIATQIPILQATAVGMHRVLQ